jgi:eukaryotic-like serine/threonine-protein kinase
MLSPTADLGRFRREAQSLAALTHENIMRVYDYGEDEAGPFMALEWLPRGTLEERLREGPLAPAEARRVAERMAAGLAHLHARGLVHRDLKPANVLFDEEERPKLGDFGLARSTAGAGTLTEAGTVMGTAAYLSPEQAGGETAGPASDVYSFGVILFRMLTGALPFVADQPLALMNMHRQAPPPAVEELQPDAPPDLAALTAAALSKDPAQRPADGSALLAALGEAPTLQVAPAETAVTRVIPAAGAPPPEPQPGPPRRPFWREPAAIAAAVVLLAVAGGVVAWAVTRSDSSAPAATASTGTKPGHTKSQPTTTLAPTTHSPTTQTQPPTTTAAPTTTTTPTTTQAPPTTTIPTTAPTTTAPTTTAPTTTTAIGTTITVTT